MAFKPANNIQDLQYFGEFGGVNPSISDSSTYTFLSAKTMFDTFEGMSEPTEYDIDHRNNSSDLVSSNRQILKEQIMELIS